MPNEVTAELNAKQVEKLIERLPLEVKIRLTRKLEKETYCYRWDKILREIDERVKKHPISEKEIDQEIEAYRKEKNAKSRH
ncbi:MAG: hypothetical protein NC904_04665 [Candidatus Omnitrophica bacterium]|nr:hypothetical protein [Candidatus Omnitrophota bacterium]